MILIMMTRCSVNPQGNSSKNEGACGRFSFVCVVKKRVSEVPPQSLSLSLSIDYALFRSKQSLSQFLVVVLVLFCCSRCRHHRPEEPATSVCMSVCVSVYVSEFVSDCDRESFQMNSKCR
jgi:hypothetical protein